MDVVLLLFTGLMHDFGSFFDLPHVSTVVNITQMSDFLEVEGVTGRLGDGQLPPGNKTTFDRRRPLWEYIRSVSTIIPFVPERHVMGFDVDMDPQRWEDMRGNRALAQYTKDLQDKKVLHFTSAMDGATRWLVHYYAFYFFGDRRTDNYIKRFARDHLHYKDDIMCQAGRIVDLILQEAGPEGFAAMHIRRGDFQFKDTRLDAPQIFNNVADLLVPGEVVYILTDEKNKTFFDPVSHKYQLRYLTDYWDKSGMDKANPNHAGMIEQVVASMANKFIGTFHSTFTG